MFKNKLFINTLPQESKYVREQVFVIEQGFKNEFDDKDAISIHTVFYDNDSPIATGRSYETKVPGEYIIGRVAVLKEYRGLGLGKDIIESLEKALAEKHPKKITIIAQLHAQGFYEKCGYVATNEQALDENRPHIIMVKELNKNL